MMAPQPGYNTRAPSSPSSGGGETPAPTPSTGGGPGGEGTPAPTPAPAGGGGPGGEETPAPIGSGGEPGDATPVPTPSPNRPGGDDTFVPTVSPDGGSPVPAPTPPTVQQCQERDRTQVLMEVITNETNLQESDLDDNSTPTGQAFEWLDGFDEDTDPCTYPTVVSRFAMAVFFFATGGESWKDRTGWLSPQPECEWYQVSCDDDDGLVTGIALGM